MAEHNKRHNETGSNREQNSSREGSIGNQQQTSQTGAQNNRGDNIDQQEDEYTKDLNHSGDRNSSNRKTGS
ncbi:MAG TPA: hypothetical protein VFT06_13125 [Flavisolibacter sp.]|nr:hypothetical protein [Flavisolibacter sp.]